MGSSEPPWQALRRGIPLANGSESYACIFDVDMVCVCVFARAWLRVMVTRTCASRLDAIHLPALRPAVQVAQLKMNLATATEEVDSWKSKLEKFKVAAAEKLKQDREKYVEHLQVSTHFCACAVCVCVVRGCVFRNGLH